MYFNIYKIHCIFKPLFHSSQKSTRKLAASAFKYCDWMKAFTPGNSSYGLTNIENKLSFAKPRTDYLQLVAPSVMMEQFCGIIAHPLSYSLHSSQKPIRKLAARTFIQSQYLKAHAANLRVDICDEREIGSSVIKRGLKSWLYSIWTLNTAIMYINNPCRYM